MTKPSPWQSRFLSLRIMGLLGTSRRAKEWSNSSKPSTTHRPIRRVVKGSRITLTIKAANWVIIEVNNTLAQLLGTVNCPWQYWTILLNTLTGMFPRILNINKIGSWHPVTWRPRSTIENSPIRSHTERLIDTLEQLTKDEDLRPDSIIIGEFNEREEEDMDIDYDFVKPIRVHYIWNLFDWLRCECDERDMGDIIVTLQDDNAEDVQTMTTVLGCHTITIHEESVSPTIRAQIVSGQGIMTLISANLR